MMSILRSRELSGRDAVYQESFLVGKTDSMVVLIIACTIIGASIVGLFEASSVLDDSYIFARYADNILEGRGIVFNPVSSPTYGLTSLGYLIAVIPFRVLAARSPSLAMLCSSLASGLGFIVITAILIRLVGRSFDGRWRRVTSLLAVVALAHAASNLAMHFVSGMDTMFALAYVALYLTVATLFENDSSFRNTIAVGILGGAALWVRPDLLLYTLGIPVAIAVFSKDSGTRVKSCVALAITVSFSGLMIIANVQYFGSPFPLPFYAKTLGLYGPTIESVYRYEGLIQLHRYLASYAVLFSVIVFALALGRKSWWESLSAVGKGALVATVPFLIFYCFFVLQLMPNGQRFFYPTLPAILLLTVESLRYFSRKHESEFTKPSRFRHVAVVVFFVFYLMSPSAIWNLGRLLIMPGIWARGFEVADDYRNRMSGYWFCLDKFSELPDDLVMAATEIGHPIAMNQRKWVIDLTGLNETMLAHERFSSSVFFSVYRPDVIFMPHVDYAEMTADMISDPYFRANYEYYPPQITGTELGVAIKRNSTYYSGMKSLVDRNIIGRVLRR